MAPTLNRADLSVKDRVHDSGMAAIKIVNLARSQTNSLCPLYHDRGLPRGDKSLTMAVSWHRMPVVTEFDRQVIDRSETLLPICAIGTAQFGLPEAAMPLRDYSRRVRTATRRKREY
jgi:hypothetical protein